MMHAFYEADPNAYPMTMEATCSYVWLQQALIILLSARVFDGEILGCVRSGGIAYEMCRPVHIYDMWFARCTASRLSSAGLRCIPILAVASILPESYRMSPPADSLHFFLFLLTLGLGLLVVVAFSMLIYISGFYTVSSDGILMIAKSVVDLLTGALIPLPFFPERVQRLLELLPFASMQNVPLRIYSGDLTGSRMYWAIAVQIFWLAVLAGSGRLLCRRAERRVTIQGG